MLAYVDRHDGFDQTMPIASPWTAAVVHLINRDFLPCRRLFRPSLFCAATADSKPRCAGPGTLSAASWVKTSVRSTSRRSPDRFLRVLMFD